MQGILDRQPYHTGEARYHDADDRQEALPLDGLRALAIKKAKAGQLKLLAGTFNSKAEPKIAKCLPLIERALIRHFLSQ
jgi:hypothetical protein